MAQVFSRLLALLTVRNALIAVGIFFSAFIATCVVYANSPLPPEAPPPGRITYEFAGAGDCGRPTCRLNVLWPDDVDVSGLPRRVVDAFVSAEDRRFFERDSGVDGRALVRALAQGACLIGSSCQGGSTIAMQVAKVRYTGRQGRDLRLKLHEVFIAEFQLSRDMEREDLLGRYLASVHFGRGLTGLRAASRYYFNKTPNELTLAEAAYLAGSLPAPAYRNIERHRRTGLIYAERVLDRMLEDGRITAAQHRRAVRNPARFRPGMVVTLRRPYLIDYLQTQAAAEDLGRTVMTTIDFDIQDAAEDAVAQYTPEARRLGANCVALVAIRPNGALVAMVGGIDYSANTVNCAVSERQPGSTFKLITIAAAVDAGARADDWVEDAPLCLNGWGRRQWCPRNFNDAYHGWISVRDAAALSANSAAIRLAQHVGLNRVAAMARRAGLDGDFDTDEPAFLLGAVEATPFEMALALARITGCANAEVHVFPRSERHCRPLLTGREAAEFDAIMRAPLQYGTARAAAFAGGGACIGKTGTNGERDAWFVGRCGEIITAVWMGRRDRGQIRMQGGQTPARTWARFMDRALELETRRARAR